MQPADVVRSYLESFATGDPSVIAAHVSDDFVNVQIAALGSGCQTRAVYEQRLGDFLSTMVGLTYEPERLVQDGGQVMVAYRMRAEWQGETPIDIRGVQSLVVDAGLITQRTDYWDAATFLQQVNPEAAEALRSWGAR